MSSIIFPLDNMVFSAAQGWYEKLYGRVGLFKVGLELFVMVGPKIFSIIEPSHCMLDLKFHDIPNTMEGATKRAVELGVRFLTVHASSGTDAMKRCVEAAKDSKTDIVAVTILTSLKFNNDRFYNYIEDAREAGVTHFVCSPSEFELGCIKRIGGIAITPGVSLSGEQRDDQKRVCTPQEAKKNGADYLVIGRPIRNAKDPIEVVDSINNL